MQQELGYTLAGTVAGVGLGVLVWFMDPLNPDVTLRDTTVDGLIVGTLLGSMFGFTYYRMRWWSPYQFAAQ